MHRVILYFRGVFLHMQTLLDGLHGLHVCDRSTDQLEDFVFNLLMAGTGIGLCEHVRTKSSKHLINHLCSVGL